MWSERMAVNHDDGTDMMGEDGMGGGGGGVDAGFVASVRLVLLEGHSPLQRYPLGFLFPPTQQLLGPSQGGNDDEVAPNLFAPASGVQWDK